MYVVILVFRDPRGFAVKFYTEEGNWDLVGNNTPIFFIRNWFIKMKMIKVPPQIMTSYDKITN